MIKGIKKCTCGCADFLVSRDYPYGSVKFSCIKCGNKVVGKNFEDAIQVWNYKNTTVVYKDKVLISDMLDKYYQYNKETIMTKNSVQRFLDTHHISKMCELQTKYKVQGLRGLQDVPGCGASVANIFLCLLTHYENPKEEWF